MNGTSCRLDIELVVSYVGYQKEYRTTLRGMLNDDNSLIKTNN